MVNQELRTNETNPGASNPVEKSIRVPGQVYPYTAGIFGGLLGGLAMIPVALAYGLVSGRGFWYPVNLIAATVIRSWQHTSPSQLEQFNYGGLILGLYIHLLVAVLLGLAFAVILPALPGTPILWAFIVSPILWAGATFAGLPLFNPIMAQYINWPSFALANILYCLVLGLYISRVPKIPAG